MATEPEPDALQVEVAAPDLPDIAVVIEGTLTVATEDDAAALVALRGMSYLVNVEFARQQPALALLYECELVLLGTRRGSRKFDFKILVKLRKRAKAEMKKAGAVAVISAVLGLPGTVLSGLQLYEHLFPPVEVRLNVDLPQTPTTIEIREFRQADAREVPPPAAGRSFEL